MDAELVGDLVEDVVVVEDAARVVVDVVGLMVVTGVVVDSLLVVVALLDEDTLRHWE